MGCCCGGAVEGAAAHVIARLDPCHGRSLPAVPHGPWARRRITGHRCQLGAQMGFLIGILLIIVGAPLVGVIGSWIEDAGHVTVGKTISVGGYLVVLGVAAWLIVSSF